MPNAIVKCFRENRSRNYKIYIEKSKTNNNKTLMAYSEKLLEVIEKTSEVE